MMAIMKGPFLITYGMDTVFTSGITDKYSKASGKWVQKMD
jgi:hypothetical protein